MLRHDSDRFCTVALVRLCDIDSRWTATACCGGHPLPLLVRDGKATGAGGPGSLLGVLPEPRFDAAAVDLEPGDALVLYTDGVTEARRDGEFFGDDGLARAVAAHGGSAASIAEGVLTDVLAFQGDNPRDDIAVVVVRVP